MPLHQYDRTYVKLAKAEPMEEAIAVTRLGLSSRAEDKGFVMGHKVSTNLSLDVCHRFDKSLAV